MAIIHGMPTSVTAISVVATTAGIATSLLAGPESPGQLERFYQHARPPGFWGPVLDALGEAPAQSQRRLYRGLAATVLAALSVFSLLTGLGSWLVGSPEPGWFASRPLWIALLLAGGLGLVPIWWRLGFSRAQ